MQHSVSNVHEGRRDERSAIPVVDIAFLEQIIPSLLMPMVYNLDI